MKKTFIGIGGVGKSTLSTSIRNCICSRKKEQPFFIILNPLNIQKDNTSMSDKEEKKNA